MKAHDSDCALHNAPAIAKGICDCHGHTVVKFGTGEVIIQTGSYHGLPAIFFEPAAIGGKVGEAVKPKAEFDDPYSVKDGGVVLTTQTKEAAHGLFHALTGHWPFIPTHKHLKTGGLYMLLPGTVKIEATWEDGYEYINKAGERIIRSVKEFDDGRFEKLTDPSKAVPQTDCN